MHSWTEKLTHRRLLVQYGRGFTVTNLKSFRKFYLVFSDRNPCLGKSSGQLKAPSQDNHNSAGLSRTGQTVSAEFISGLTAEDAGFQVNLSWSHYQLLMRVKDDHARSFYEIEAERNHWSVRQLERQISSHLFERLAKSRDKEGLLELANEGHTIQNPVDMMKDPAHLYLALPALSAVRGRTAPRNNPRTGSLRGIRPVQHQTNR